MSITPEQIDTNLKRMQEINNYLISSKQQNKDISVAELVSIKEESERLHKETNEAIALIMESFNNTNE